MDEHQLDWVDGRLTRLEGVVSEHAVAVRALTDLVPEIKRLVKISYIVLGALLVFGLLTKGPAFVNLVASIITSGVH